MRHGVGREITTENVNVISDQLGARCHSTHSFAVDSKFLTNSFVDSAFDMQNKSLRRKATSGAETHTARFSSASRFLSLCEVGIQPAELQVISQCVTCKFWWLVRLDKQLDTWLGGSPTWLGRLLARGLASYQAAEFIRDRDQPGKNTHEVQLPHRSLAYLSSAPKFESEISALTALFVEQRTILSLISLLFSCLFFFRRCSRGHGSNFVSFLC